MDAMTMEFTAGNGNDLQGLEPGDVVQFRLLVGADRSWIEQCHKTGERDSPTARVSERSLSVALVAPILAIRLRRPCSRCGFRVRTMSKTS